MNFLAPSLTGLALFLVAASAAADPPLAEPGAAVAEAPPAIAVRVIPSPWEPAPSPPKLRVRIPRSRVKRGLLLGGVAGLAVSGALATAGAELIAHPPYDRSCLVAIFGCPRRPDYFPGGLLIGAGATFAAAGVALGSVGLSLSPRRPDEQPPRAALSFGPGSARVAFAF